jgi:hypothetical protein
MLEIVRPLGWLRLIRMLAQYIAPSLLIVAFAAELTGAGDSHALNIVLAILFSFLTVVMLGICGLTVFLWHIDRLFFRLESRIDGQLAETPYRR